MRAVPILLYHSVSDDPPEWIRALAVSPEVFAAQLAVIVESGMTALSAGEWAALIEAGKSPPARPVVITFDDGLADFEEHAFPALRRAGLPATLYVTTGFLEGLPESDSFDGRPPGRWLDAGGLAGLAEHGIEIGAHTHTHPQLDTLPLEAARAEIVRSREILERLLGAPVSTFAYPFGYHGPLVRSLVQQAGFASACAVKNALSFAGDDRLALARLTVRAETTPAQLAEWLAGRGAPRAPQRELARTRAWRAYRRGRTSLRGRQGVSAR